MKYRSKFSAAQKHFHTSYTMRIDEGQSFTDVEGLTPGVFVFIPFTDTRFFEPVKTRKFQVEVSEDDMDRFDSLINDGFEPWTVNEITENEYLQALKNAYSMSSQVIVELSDLDKLNHVVAAYKRASNECYHQGKLSVIKWMKYWLVDNYKSISGLKEAKEIVDAWWDL